MNNVININDRSKLVFTSLPILDMKLPWGINPPKSKPIAWGARAVFRRTTHTVDIDYIHDRAEMVGGTDEERAALAEWINRVAIPRIRHEVKESDVWPRDATQVELPVDGMMIVFSPKASCGYLFIGIWPSEGLLSASFDVYTQQMREEIASGKRRPTNPSNDPYSSGWMGVEPPLVAPPPAQCGACAAIGTNATGGPRAHSPNCPKEAEGPRSLAVNATGKRKKGFTTRPKEPKDKKEKKPFLAVVIETGKAPEVRDIGDAKLETLQALVDGPIQPVPFARRRRYTVWVNEEGLLRDMPLNKIVPYDDNYLRGTHRLHGTIVLAQSKSMTREFAEQLVKEWSK